MGVKQVIVIRKDLGMRKGKMCAQAAHASVNVVIELMFFREDLKNLNAKHPQVTALNDWIDTGTKKIAVSVNSEAELGTIYQKAYEAGMPCSIITDAGHTEFHGVPTKTAVAIGPWDEDEIDKITGELSLL